MKHLCILFAFVSVIGFSQEKYLTKSGLLNFEASVEAFEEIKATNTNVTAILNTANGQFAALALVKGFRFKNALMEEHFNENYAESDEFPKAIFKGELSGYSIENIQTTYSINGTLSFHGVTKTLENVSVEITPSENSLNFKGLFEIAPNDFDIEIPSIVSSKIADSVTVVFDFELMKK
ncbi:YceI family protein [Flavobacteriaceae bacterium]|nr:YceI family protein [Flavobacteriaceae bacterium]MDC1265467.1 YceI family protein [Flavobacteriaceae bacterium]